MKSNAKNMSGLHFGFLLVISRAGSTKRGYATWSCRCACGNLVVVSGSKLRRGKKTRCDPQFHPPQKLPNRSSLAYRSWRWMRDRCLNFRNCNFKNYGGRGIKVCERWMDFDNFFSDMGDRPSSKHSIERIDVNGNYEPGNCRWALNSEQCANKRSTRFVFFRGKEVRAAEVARAHGIAGSLLWSRLRRGVTIEDALVPPCPRTGRTPKIVTWQGKPTPLRDLCIFYGLKHETVSARLRKGWPLRKALTRIVPFRGVCPPE